MKVSAVKGMRDILPPESKAWEGVERIAKNLFESYGFSEIRTPIVEPASLFSRSVGETSDIVEKEMYTFEDRKGATLALRPEGTAPVVRAYVEGGLYAKDPIAKLYYLERMFRYSRPQKGRARQFFQMGVELLGTESPFADAELLILAHHFFQKLGLNSQVRLEINSLGCNACRPNYQETLQKFLKDKKSKFCLDCERRIQKNPLRVLDCKNEVCQNLSKEVPLISDFWCESCRNHYREVCGLLVAGHVPFNDNPRIVRGLDYYQRTTFEWISTGLGAQDAVGAGGRYDGLVKELGGPDVPGVGFALGMERLMLLSPQLSAISSQPPIFFVLLGIPASQRVLASIFELRAKGVAVECGYEGSLKSQMRRADKLGAKKVVIVGEEEVTRGIAQIKDMESGKQQEVLLGRLVDHLS